MRILVLLGFACLVFDSPGFCQQISINLLGEQLIKDGNSLETFSDSFNSPSDNGQGPEVYYLFADSSELWFVQLAENSDVTSGKLLGNNVYKRVRTHVGSNTKLVNVKISTATEIMFILQNGLLPALDKGELRTVPAADGQKVPCYSINDLSRPSNCRVRGFGIISHGGCDGPLLADGQMTADYFRQEAGRGGKPVVSDADVYSDNGEPSCQTAFKLYPGKPDDVPYVDWSNSANGNFSNRLMDQAKVTYFGCNTGSCQGYNDNPSIAHYTAALYADKRVSVFGKKSYGNPNEVPSAFAEFTSNEKGLASRSDNGAGNFSISIPDPLKPRLSEETAHIPANDQRHDFYNTLNARGLSVFQIQYNSDDSTTITYGKSNFIRVDFGRGQDPATKMPVMAEFVKMLIEAKSTTDLQPDWFDQLLKRLDKRHHSRAKNMKQKLDEQIMYGEALNTALRESAENNKGTADPNDFRIWREISRLNYGSQINKAPCCCNNVKLHREETLGIIPHITPVTSSSNYASPMYYQQPETNPSPEFNNQQELPGQQEPVNQLDLLNQPEQTFPGEAQDLSPTVPINW